MRRPSGEEGVVAILVAAMAIVLFGFAAIVVDLGFARQLKQQAVDSADAASLAGAADLDNCTRRRCSAATAAVKKSAQQNFDTSSGSWAGCAATPPTGGRMSGVEWRQRRSGTSCIQYGLRSTSSRPVYIFVSLPPKDSASFFGAIIGYTGTSIDASAVAGQITTSVPPCALCVLDDINVGTSGPGSGGSVKVAGAGSLYADTATVAGGTMTVNGGQIYLTETPSSTAGMSPTPIVTNRSVRDPFFGDRPPDTTGGGQDVPGECDDVALAPGRYHDPLIVTGNCTLADGVYEFDEDVTVTPQGNLTGSNVTVVLSDSASLVINALGIDKGTVTLSQPDPDAQFALYDDGAGDIVVRGGLLSILVGDVYARNDELRVDNAGTASIAGTLVVDALRVNGLGLVDVFPIEPAPGPQVGRPDLGLVL